MTYLTLPYLTLPYGEDVLPPSAEASNGPSAHPRINRNLGPYQHLEPSPSQVRAYSFGPTYYCALLVSPREYQLEST